MVEKYFKGSVWFCELLNVDEESCVTRGYRPIVIVSNSFDNNSPVVTVVPCTSKTSNYEYHYATDICGRLGYVMCEQIRTVDKSTLKNLQGVMSANDIKHIDNIIKQYLSISVTNEEEIPIEKNGSKAIEKFNKKCFPETVESKPVETDTTRKNKKWTDALKAKLVVWVTQCNAGTRDWEELLDEFDMTKSTALKYSSKFRSQGIQVSMYAE